MADHPNDSARELLRFDAVTVDESHGYAVGIRGVSFVLRAGELALVMLERPNFRTPLADAASGLIEPDAGKICFRDRDWSRTMATRAAEMRGCIGRIFEGYSWVSNLNVDENVLLPAMHHTSRPTAKLLAEVQDLAERFGLSSIPETRPAHTAPQELNRSAAVRAFLGEPELLLLERPEHGLYPDLMPPLIASVHEARARGAAVLWLTNLAEVFENPELKPSARYRMQGPSLLPLVDAARVANP